MWPLRNPLSSLFFLFINSFLSSSNYSTCKTSSFFPIALLSDHTALFNFWIRFLLLCFCFSFFDLRSMNPRNGNCFGLLGFWVREDVWVSAVLNSWVVRSFIWLFWALFGCWECGGEIRGTYFIGFKKLRKGQSGGCVRCSWVVVFVSLGLNSEVMGIWNSSLLVLGFCDVCVDQGFRMLLQEKSWTELGQDGWEWCFHGNKSKKFLWIITRDFRFLRKLMKTRVRFW